MLYNKTTQSTISIEETRNGVCFHLREWREWQQIKDARIELDADEIGKLIEMLHKCLEQK